MSTPSLIRKTLLLTTCAILLGSASCSTSGPWRRIISFPEKAVEILAVNDVGDLYIRTGQGTVYYCTYVTNWSTCKQVTQTEVPAVKLAPRWQNPTCMRSTVAPVPPSRIVDSVVLVNCFEMVYYWKLAILEDGNIWRWSEDVTPPYAIAGLVVIGAISGIILLAIVVVALVIRVIIKRKTTTVDKIS